MKAMPQDRVLLFSAYVEYICADEHIHTGFVWIQDWIVKLDQNDPPCAPNQGRPQIRITGRRPTRRAFWGSKLNQGLTP